MSVGLSGRVVVGAEDSLSQEAISRRLDELETFINGSPSTASESSPTSNASNGDAGASAESLAARAKALNDRLDVLETHDMKLFQIGLVDIGPRLGAWNKPVCDKVNLPDEVKLKVVESEAEGLQTTCAQLQEITELQGHMNPAYLNEMPVFLKRVAKLEAKYVGIAERAKTFQKGFQKTLQDYNEVMDLLSLKAAEWDEQLSRIEEKTGV